MFRSSMRSSSGSSLFISLSKLLILKTIKIFKNYYQSNVVMWQHMFSVPVMRTVWRRELSSSTSGSSKWSLSPRFPHQNPAYGSPLPHTCCMSNPLILLDLITLTIFSEQYRSLNSSIYSFLQSPVTSSLLGPNILFNALFSNTLSLGSSLVVSDQVSHPYNRTGKIIFRYILIFIFLGSKVADKILHRMIARIP